MRAHARGRNLQRLNERVRPANEKRTGQGHVREDRNLLRMAVAELLGFPGTPAPIVIDEALEIARRYSAPESIDFLNGMLDAIAKSRL